MFWGPRRVTWGRVNVSTFIPGPVLSSGGCRWGGSRQRWLKSRTYGDGASHVMELGIHLRCTDEHQIITDRYHEDELAFHLVRRSILCPWQMGCCLLEAKHAALQRYFWRQKIFKMHVGIHNRYLVPVYSDDVIVMTQNISNPFTIQVLRFGNVVLGPPLY